ncbi:MAG: FAD-binding oxidoreductase, partial [Candidatus Marinimicrobia bacterium]|nr:FAD-binding oxidoreductase [Candidatus Neomarinimicrobiota bacterium]
EVIVRLTPLAPSVKTMLATFPTVAGATESVSAILSAGVLPAALELIDNLCIQAVEAHLKAGFPTEAAAILLIELDGEESEIANESAPVEKACRQNGATDFRVAQGEDERQQLWRGRKHAVGSLGKLSPAFYTNDGVVPRSKLTTILSEIYRIGSKHSLRVANVCHAGDGSMHPLVLFDPTTADGAARAMECSEEILLACLEIGGSITGEHGVGVEKRHMMNRMFSARDLEHMARLRTAFNPHDLLNPGKVLPGGATRGEVKAGVSIPGGSWI